MKKTFVNVTLVLALAAAPLSAQTPSTEVEAWRALARLLGPAAMVVVQLKNGKRIQGTLLQQSEDALVLKPRTRVPVPARTIAFTDVESISRKKIGWSPGAKVLTGIGIGFGVMFLGIAIAFASGGY